MFDRFTDRARKTMGLALQAAQGLQHDYIGTEHILLGLIQEGSGVASDVLANLDVDIESIREGVEKLVRHGTTTVTMGQLPFTPRGKKVLELAYEEASNLGHNYIGTEHLLLGLIREQEGIAAQVLQNIKVRLEDVREEVLELLGAEAGADRDGAPARHSSARLLGFDDAEMPKEHAATVLSLLEARGVEIRSTGSAGAFIAFAPWRDPQRMFEVGFARGRRRLVIALHLPGDRIELPGVVSIELGDNLENSLAALFRPGS